MIGLVDSQNAKQVLKAERFAISRNSGGYESVGKGNDVTFYKDPDDTGFDVELFWWNPPPDCVQPFIPMPGSGSNS